MDALSAPAAPVRWARARERVRLPYRSPLLNAQAREGEMLERLIEQWLAQSPQREDAVLRFVEQGGALPTEADLQRAAANPLVRAYLQKGLELFSQMARDPQVAPQIQVLRWRIETVLEALDKIQSRP